MNRESIDRKIIIKIKSIIFKYIKTNKYSFFLYGSRVNEDFRIKSDYDIGVIGDKPLSAVTKLEIEEEFENIPALIDFTDFTQVNDNFKKQAMKNIVWLNK